MRSENNQVHEMFHQPLESEPCHTRECTKLEKLPKHNSGLAETATEDATTTQDTPGLYEIVEDGTVVTRCVSTETVEIAELNHGTVVHVVEVVVVPDEKRIRGRVVPRPGTNTSVLAGWISLHDTDDGFRWANKVEPCRSDEPGVYMIIEDGTVITGGLSTESAEVAELDHGAVIEVVEVAVVPEEHRVRGRIDSAVSSDKGPARPAGWISLHDTSDDFRWATKVDASHVDGPGTYVIVEDETVVTVDSSLESTEVAELAHGTRVEVTEVRIMGDEQRIRAHLLSPEGWISVLDTADGFRWAWMVPLDMRE